LNFFPFSSGFLIFAQDGKGRLHKHLPPSIAYYFSETTLTEDETTKDQLKAHIRAQNQTLILETI